MSTQISQIIIAETYNYSRNMKITCDVNWEFLRVSGESKTTPTRSLPTCEFKTLPRECR